MAIHHFHNKIRGMYRGIVHRNNITSRRARSAIVHFSEKVGLVYFGSVDQHSDDHRIVRGLTASANHQDEHYAVGTYEDYDVSIVNRMDTTEDSTGRLRTHSWLILEINLKYGADLPHIFMGMHEHKDSPYSKLFITHPSMQRVPIGTFEPYAQEFTARYSLYAHASHFIQVERYFNANITKVIAAHFWPLSVEINEGSLYLYADNQPVTIRLLDAMLKNGLWLAKQLDAQNIG
jgi:hypothetical protein